MSFYPSVTFLYSVKTAKHIVENSLLPGSPIIRCKIRETVGTDKLTDRKLYPVHRIVLNGL